jgi:two-component system response regulator FixJ
VNTSSEATVHLVDDDAAVRDSLKILLESFGLEVRVYESAREFLQKAGAWESGCLVLDLHLPIMSGLDLLTAMRERRIRLPVVLMTGRGDKETKERALKSGAIAFLDKPVRETALMAAIYSALSGLDSQHSLAGEPVELSAA